MNSLVFSDMVSGWIFYAERGTAPTDRSGSSYDLQALQIIINGSVQNLADAVGCSSTYAAGNRAGLGLGSDADGELYLLTKGDGWIRKLVSP